MVELSSIHRCVYILVIHETLRTKSQFAGKTTCGGFSADVEAKVVRRADDWFSFCETLYAKEVMQTDFTESFGEISDRDQDVTVTARVVNCEGVVVVCVGGICVGSVQIVSVDSVGCEPTCKNFFLPSYASGGEITTLCQAFSETCHLY